MLALVLWMFSLATSLLLGGAWGRGVSGDTEALSDAAAALVQTDLVRDRVTTLLEEGFATTGLASEGLLSETVSAVLAQPEVEAALSGLATDVVAALAAPPGTEATVDVADHLRPAVVAIAADLSAAGVDVDVDTVVGELARWEPIAIDTGTTQSDGGPLLRARSSLTLVVVVALAAMAALGGLALLLADDGTVMLRTLAGRVAWSALSFTVMLRVGAWAFDPRGGRAPVRRSLSIILGSSQVWPFAIGVIALVVAALGWLIVATRRKPARE